MSETTNRGIDLLEQLLLPNTPDAVRQAYLSLADRAKTQAYGLFEEDVVVVDTETTGLDFKSSELMEIAAARMSGTEIVEEFHSFVAISHPIPPEIRALTGIKEIDLVGAPSATKAVHELIDFVQDAPVIAHNAGFDRTFLENVPKVDKVTSRWIDSLTLSRIALPMLKSHKLADLAAAFDCPEGTHRAADDVRALCAVWRVLLCALSDLPESLIAQLAHMHPEQPWQYRQVFSMLLGNDTGSGLTLVDIRKEILRGATKQSRPDALEQDRELTVPSEAEIEEAFSKEGLLSRMYPRFEPRKSQVQMAQEVRQAFDEATHRALEAGTGVGKSMAYLVPAALFAKENQLTIGVATKTNALSDQLMSYELPKLAEAIPGGVSYMSLKGFNHYPCLRKLQRAYTADLPVTQAADSGRSQRATASDMLDAIALTSTHAVQSYNDDIDMLGIRWRSVPRSMLTTNSSECLRTHCPFFPAECMVHGARRRASATDIVVTNHSLLLNNVSAEGNILPKIRYWIIDEAHSIEEEARKQWAVKLSHEECRAVFDALGGQRAGFIASTMRAVAKDEENTLIESLLAKLAAVASRASISAQEFFASSNDLLELSPSGAYDNVIVWIDVRVRRSRQFENLVTQAKALQDQLNLMIGDLGDILTLIGEKHQPQAAGLSDSLRSIQEIEAALALIMAGDDTSYVYSASLTRSSKKTGAESLLAEKLDVGKEIMTQWYPELKSVVYCSATIASSHDFTRFNHAVGFNLLDDTDYRCMSLPSSFDYDYQMQALIVDNLPSPTDRAYLGALEDLLFKVHTSMQGSVLTLFTNRREMETLWHNLSPRLKEEGLELLCQQRTGGTQRIARKFIAEKESSLFALKSFWEGFDAAGDTLRCVVIPKLPFASPNDPLVKERDLREERSWWRYSLPDAVLSVKQAAGRLIRTSNDKGIVILCDSRLVTKSYGKSFIKALPTNSCHQISADNVAGFIEMWRRSRE